MYSYFNNNNDDDEMNQLDRMAREINDKKKNFNLIKSVHNDFYDDIQKNKHTNNININDAFIDNKHDDNMTSDMSSLLEKLKNEHNSHIFSEYDSIKSDSEESIIKHLKNCTKCKSKVKLVFDNIHVNKHKKIKHRKSFVIDISNLKEYLTIILLCFLVILVIYIFFKLK